MALDSMLLKELVGDVMRHFHEPYPEDIIDRVFQRIATDDGYELRYSELLATSSAGKYSVNPSIGRAVKAMTGMETREYPCIPCLESRQLITSYSRLGYGSK